MYLTDYKETINKETLNLIAGAGVLRGKKTVTRGRSFEVFYQDHVPSPYAAYAGELAAVGRPF